MKYQVYRPSDITLTKDDEEAIYDERMTGTTYTELAKLYKTDWFNIRFAYLRHKKRLNTKKKVVK